MEGGKTYLFDDIKNFFLDLFENLKSKKLAKLTPIIAVLCLLAILIPTLIAVWQVYFKGNEELATSAEVSVVLYDADGAALAESSVAETNINVSPLVETFYNLYVSKTELESLPDMTDRSPNYKAHISYGDTNIDFLCYFTEDPASSYISDNNGSLYGVDATYYSKFLDMEYSDAAYSSATPPTLITKDGDTVLPFIASWSYKKLDGTTKSSGNIATAPAGEIYSASGSIGLSFSKAPDFCSVVVTDVIGKEIYHGDLDGLSSITANVGDKLKFSVEAEWSNLNGADSFGKIKYDFELLFRNLATFSVSNSEATPGSFVVISAFDIEDGTTPTYTPDTDIGKSASIFNYTGNDTALDYLSYIDALDFLEDFEPLFFKDGDALKAFLPIPYNTPIGDFTFSLSCGVATSTHTVKIVPSSPPDTISISSTDSSANVAVTKPSVNEVLDISKRLVSSNRAEPLFRGAFLSPLSFNYTREYSFGDSFTRGDEPIDKFSALGNAYLSSNDESRRVCSLNVGVVIKTGSSTHLGSFAVVDHGGGLFIWYCHLSDFDVREGDTVAKGEVIGKSGESILLDGNGVLILCSLKGTFVDPSLILGKEIL